MCGKTTTSRNGNNGNVNGLAGETASDMMR
jgi:hypothetical protein